MLRLRCLLLLVAIFSLHCGNPPTDSGDDAPCSCGEGTRRCVGTAVQICEHVSDSCASFGPQVECATGMCSDGSCGGSCQDACTAGAARCTPTAQREICRLTNTGCLDWVSDACPGGQFCDKDNCVANIPCDPACPTGFTCQPSGTCSGGDAQKLVLNIPANVQISGSILMNGAPPMRDDTICSATINPNVIKAEVKLTEINKGYSYTLSSDNCAADTFNFSGSVQPGTYSVSVYGRMSSSTGRSYSTLPLVPFINDNSLTIVTDLTNKVLNVKTVQLAGSITLNGALPVRDDTICSATINPNSIKAQVTLTETTKGYSFTLSSDPCSKDTFNYSGTIYPGTYRVSAVGRISTSTGRSYSNLPTVSFFTDPMLAVSSDVNSKVLDIKTVQVAGSILLNGALPVRDDTICSATINPNSIKAQVTLTETTKGYGFTLSSDPCAKDSFNYSGTIYPGTYRVEVAGRISTSTGRSYSSLPTTAFNTDTALPIASDLANKVLNIKTVQLSGSITLNGALPIRDDTICSATINPNSIKAQVSLTETAKGYSFTIPSDPCSKDSFNYSGVIYPGTYRVTAAGRISTSTNRSYSNLPTVFYFTDTALTVSSDLAGKVLDLKTVQLSGSITLNGALPVRDDTICSATINPASIKAQVTLTENSKGYGFTIPSDPCAQDSFNYSGTIYPGVYRVTAAGRISTSTNRSYSSLPTVAYVTDSALVIARDLASKVLDLRTAKLGGSVTLANMLPLRNSTYCSGALNATQRKADVRFSEISNGYGFTIPVDPCALSSFDFTGQLYPGTYQIGVSGVVLSTGDALTNLPSNNIPVVNRITLP